MTSYEEEIRLHKEQEEKLHLELKRLEMNNKLLSLENRYMKMRLVFIEGEIKKLIVEKAMKEGLEI